ncbi:MAG TPA: FAD-dependent oxidoreductase [Allosphingosinicella sp.]|uniref:FAD-dependent oxidoreductase n=1 Tax=Allosphingosinicella sp. TaxID=2823234 RepID=UPI002ED838EB
MANDEVAAIFDPTDPYNREAQTFPQLTVEQVERICPFGRLEDFPKGTFLFRRGERSVDFFVVMEGSVEILNSGTESRDDVIHVHADRQFTGELDLFNDRQILVDGRTGADSRIIRVKRPDFRRLIEAEPDIGEIIMRAFILRRVGLMRYAQGGVVLIGSGRSGDTLRIQRFLSRNGYPHRMLDTDADPDAEGFVSCLDLSEDQLPVVVLPEKALLRNPPTPELADALGLTESFDPDRIYDLTVVGAGPAGLAAAVYGASEGLDTIVVEAMAPGGQAGTSSRIENYLGFPTGISGQALAGRAQVQAQKFGARLAISRRAMAIDCDASPYCITLEDGQRVATYAIVIATGARYRTLDVPDYDKFEGKGIHYAATWIEGNLCANQEVIVVGGGNSAGQAAVFLSQQAAHVHVLVRGEGLAATMSDYLIQRIGASPKISLHAHTEITGLEGDRFLERVTWTNRRTGESETRPVANLFVMIGAVPNTDWLDGCVPLDRGGFVVTGKDGEGMALSSPYVTERPGIYAVGDVRAGSTKRVASGVGEGSVVVSAVHQYLAEVRTRL